MSEERSFIYDVALSFAGEDRAYVKQVADALTEKGIKVFYDEAETAQLWGKDLYAQLLDIYQSQARYTIMFISEHYAKKMWTIHERKSAQARALEENREYVLPVRFDDTQIPGILKTTAYVDLRTMSAVEFSEIVILKLKSNPRTLREPLAEMPPAVVTIAREKRWMGMANTFYILIDDEPIGTLQSGESGSFKIEPGEYDFQVTYDEYGIEGRYGTKSRYRGVSEKRKVRLLPGKNYLFKCGYQPGGLFRSFFGDGKNELFIERVYEQGFEL